MKKCPPGLASILPPHYGYGEIFKKQANRRTRSFEKQDKQPWDVPQLMLTTESSDPPQGMSRFAPPFGHNLTLSCWCGFSAIPANPVSSPAFARQFARSENPGCSAGCMPRLWICEVPPQAALHPSHRAWSPMVLCS